METGKVEYAPDYESEKRRLPTIKEMSGSINYGGRVVFEDGEPVVLTPEESIAHEHARLKDVVANVAKEERRLERLADEGRNTLVRTDALINSSRATRVRRTAVDALIAFEAEHKIGE